VARTPAQRGRIGTWLVQARLARGYETQAVARREIERLAGWRIPQSQYAEWESGRRVPSEAALERLEGFYGTQQDSTPAASDLSELAASIRMLAKAIEEERAERIEWERGVVESIQALAQGLIQRDDPEPAPRASGRA
jgi:transcriptional regulator with XRE-family HTH domain